MKIVINEKQTVSDYPYGHQRTTAWFSVEHKAGKGFRSVFQTKNPKTGRINNPKKSTYHDMVYMTINSEGFVKFHYLDIRTDGDKFAGFIKFMEEQSYLMTDDQIKSVAISLLAHIKAFIVGNVQYAGAKLDDIKPFYTKAIKTLVRITKDAENLFEFIEIDWEGIASKKNPNFNPFRTVTYQSQAQLG